MDLGLEHIVAKPVVATGLDYSSVEAIVDFFQVSDELDQFIKIGNQLSVAFENVCDINKVIDKYGVTESLIHLVGSNFISMEDNSPNVLDAEGDDGEEGGSGLNEAKKEEAAAVKEGAKGAVKGLIEKIKGWLKQFGEWIAKYWNKFWTMIQNLGGKAKALAGRVRGKFVKEHEVTIDYVDENGQKQTKTLKIKSGNDAAKALEDEVAAVKECEAKKAEAQKAADEAKAACNGNPDSKKLQAALTKANRKLGAAKGACTVHARNLSKLIADIEANAKGEAKKDEAKPAEGEEKK